jgi:4-hydroxybenzoate polyprenyltransferase
MPSRPVALALSTHPGPTVAVTVISVALGVVVGLAPLQVAILGLVVLLNQASVGLSNDWIDAERDIAVGRSDKPIARGWVSARLTRNTAIVCAALSVALSVTLGWGTMIVNVVFLLAGWLYNAGLKRTPFSVMPYIVGFGVLPAIATSAAGVTAAPWVIGAGAMLGIAAHFANVLPDIDDDRETNASGLPQRLGRKVSGVTTFVVLAAASGLVVFGPGTAPGVLGWFAAAVVAAICVFGVILVLTRPPTRTLFRLIIAAAIINVAMLVLSGASIAAGVAAASAAG